MKTSNRQKIQETRNIINSNAQNTTSVWPNVLFTEINVLLFVNIKRCDFHLYSDCQGQAFPRESSAVNPETAVLLKSFCHNAFAVVHLLCSSPICTSFTDNWLHNVCI